MCVCVWACEHVHNESHVALRHGAPNFRITAVRNAHLTLPTMRAREDVAYVCAAARCAKLSYHRSARRTSCTPRNVRTRNQGGGCVGCTSTRAHERPEMRVGAADSKIWCEAATPLIRKDWRIKGARSRAGARGVVRHPS